MRIGIITSKSPSLSTVSYDIAKVMKRLGHDTQVYRYQVPWYDARHLFDRSIIVIPFDPAYCGTWILMQRDYVKAGVRAFCYVTVEGRPKAHLIPEWFQRDGIFVANSNFTARMLREVGIEPIKVVYHGVDMEAVNSVMKAATDKKYDLKKRFGWKVIFGTVANSLPRKGLDRLAEAIRIAAPKCPEAGFYLHVPSSVAPLFSGIENVFISGHFGAFDRVEYLKLVGSFDFYICSSLAEGFCLPLLEAQAFGIPAIYPDYAPLNEHAYSGTYMREYSRVPVIDIVEVKQLEGIVFLHHIYEPSELADRIIKCYELYMTDRKSYYTWKKYVRKHASQFDIKNVYSVFEKFW